MIVNGGLVKLLGAQLAYLASLQWGLFSNNAAIVKGTVFSDLTEAAWTGYARVGPAGWGPVMLVATRSITLPNTPPMFFNGSASWVEFYGWFLLDPSDNTLVGADNIGWTTLAPSALFPLAAAVTDQTS